MDIVTWIWTGCNRRMMGAVSDDRFYAVYGGVKVVTLHMNAHWFVVWYLASAVTAVYFAVKIVRDVCSFVKWIKHR